MWKLELTGTIFPIYSRDVLEFLKICTPQSHLTGLPLNIALLLLITRKRLDRRLART